MAKGDIDRLHPGTYRNNRTRQDFDTAYRKAKEFVQLTDNYIRESYKSVFGERRGNDLYFKDREKVLDVLLLNISLGSSNLLRDIRVSEEIRAELKKWGILNYATRAGGHLARIKICLDDMKDSRIDYALDTARGRDKYVKDMKDEFYPRIDFQIRLIEEEREFMFANRFKFRRIDPEAEKEIWEMHERAFKEYIELQSAIDEGSLDALARIESYSKEYGSILDRILEAALHEVTIVLDPERFGKIVRNGDKHIVTLADEEEWISIDNTLKEAHSLRDEARELLAEAVYGNTGFHTAAEVSAGTYSNLHSYDDNWYKIFVDSDTKIEVVCTYFPIYLYDSSEQLVAASADSGTNWSLDYDASRAGYYYIYVPYYEEYEGSNSYSLTITSVPIEEESYTDMVRIPAGEFMMGSNDGDNDEKPIHKVYLDAYYIDIYEVTNAQFSRFLNEKGNQKEGGVTWLNIGIEYCLIEYKNGKYQPKSGYANHPVIEVSWYGARAYAEWIGKRLPTEAEWEKAARGGLVGKKYPWGDSIDSSKVNYSRKVDHPRFGKLDCFMPKAHFWTFSSYDFILRCKSRWQFLLLVLKDLLFV